jgi:predicted RNA-binding protein YlqC (UPF0109 family)
MSEIDQQFIEYVVKSLVGKPDAVKIDRRIDEKGVLLELTVDPEDLGRVIGKRGATAQSLRTLLRALGTKNDARYNLKIVDNGVGAPSSDDSAPPAKKKPSKKSDDDDQAVPDNVVDDVASDEGEADTTPAEADQTSDRLRKAREELADLDDLDV